MKSTTCSVGDIIDAKCSQCKKVTNHVVVAMIDTKPVKVQCNTCEGIHRYRQPGSTPKAAKQDGGPRVAKQDEWNELQMTIRNEHAKDYDMETQFRAGDVIRHPSFGLGLVQRVLGSRKMEVLFEGSKKVMRCK